jgi:lipid-binding SYLF domain-containing protein
MSTRCATIRWAPIFILAVAVGIGRPDTLYGQYVQAAVPVAPQSPEAATVDASTQVLNEIMAAPATGIPLALLHDAQAIVICPSLIKGGFIIGARYGRGVLVMRTEQGAWRDPSFIRIYGGSIGWQAGIQATDVILVFKTRQSVNGLLSGKFTIGVSASAAAGPVGRDASAATDVQLKAEVYSYSRARGLFAGAALDGSVVSMDNAATASYYRGTGILWADAPPGQAAALPTSAITLLSTIAFYADPSRTPSPVPQAAIVAPQPGAPVPAVAAPITAAAPSAVASPLAGPPAVAMNTLPSDIADIRGRLANSSQRLSTRVDRTWQSYLALPPEIYNPAAQPPKSEAITAVLNRYQAVAADPKYKALAQRAEFQETFGLLKAYRDLQSVGTSPTLALPAPPPG